MNQEVEKQNARQLFMSEINANIDLLKGEIRIIDDCHESLVQFLLPHFNEKYKLKESNIIEIKVYLEFQLKEIEDAKSKVDNFMELSRRAKEQRNY